MSERPNRVGIIIVVVCVSFLVLYALYVGTPTLNTVQSKVAPISRAKWIYNSSQISEDCLRLRHPTTLRHLVANAQHELGMKVDVDVVYNMWLWNGFYQPG